MSGRERPSDRWESGEATFGFAHVAVVALALTLGYPESRTDDIWDHLSSQPLCGADR